MNSVASFHTESSVFVVLASITYCRPCISHCGSTMHYMITVLLFTRLLLWPLIHHCMSRFIQYPTFSCGQNHYVFGASEEAHVLCYVSVVFYDYGSLFLIPQ